MPNDFTAPGLDDSPRAMLDETYPEPDLVVGSTTNDLDALRDELAAQADQADEDVTTLEVPSRPGYAIRCRLDFTGLDLDRFRKAARNKRLADGLDNVRFSALLIGATTTAILKNGKPITDEGIPVTFATPAFRQLYQAANVDEAVRGFFKREGLIDAAARKLADEAGWGDEVYTADPTT